MAWYFLFAAAAFEVGFTTFMKLTGQGRWWAEAGFLFCIIASFTLLQFATKTIPIGIAYAVWTGLGAVGTLIVSQLVFQEPINRMQIGFIVLLIVAVAGIKLTAAN